MPETMPDLTFLLSDKDLWSKDVWEKIEQCIHVFKENGGEEATEDCFSVFCLDFESAKYKFLNKIRDIDLIMKCRTAADGNSNFGGKQCAELMIDIQDACNKYLNSTIYSSDKRENSVPSVLRKIRNMAQRSEEKAWNFEEKTKQEYLNTGTDKTLDIIKRTVFYNNMQKRN